MYCTQVSLKRFTQVPRSKLDSQIFTPEEIISDDDVVGFEINPVVDGSLVEDQWLSSCQTRVTSTARGSCFEYQPTLMRQPVELNHVTGVFNWYRWHQLMDIVTFNTLWLINQWNTTIIETLVADLPFIVRGGSVMKKFFTTVVSSEIACPVSGTRATRP